MAPVGVPGPPPVFAEYDELFPTSGVALEVACGRGRAAVWLAGRGMRYHGVDVSPVAIDLARRLAEREGVGELCTFEVHDLDGGLPDGPSVDLALCYLFRDPALDGQLMERLRLGGLLATAVLSEVGAEPGRFRARPGELLEAFGSLDILEHGEAGGMAWLIGRRTA